MARGNYTSKVAGNVASFTSKNNDNTKSKASKTVTEEKTIIEQEKAENKRGSALLNQETTTKKTAPNSFEYKATDSDSPLKSVAVRLIERNSDMLLARSLQLGMTKQDYFSLLLKERKDRNEPSTQSTRPIKSEYKGANSTHTIRIPQDLIDFAKMDAARNIMKITEYFNFVLDEERKREESLGLRVGRYDI